MTGSIVRSPPSGKLFGNERQLLMEKRLATSEAKNLKLEAELAADWDTLGGLAKWLGVTPKTVKKKLPAMYAAGFPHPNPATGKWYRPGSKKWAENGAAPIEDDPLMRRLEDGFGPH